jgi:hypothetical protein
MPLHHTPPVPWALIPDGDFDNGTNSTLVADTTYLRGVWVPSACVLTAVRCRVGTASGNIDCGIYDVNGNLLGHSGLVATVASSINTASMSSSISLSPGRYWLALWVDNSTASISHQQLTATTGVILAQSSAGTNTGGLASTFSGMGGVTDTVAAVCLIGLLQGGFS